MQLQHAQGVAFPLSPFSPSLFLLVSSIHLHLNGQVSSALRPPIYQTSPAAAMNNCGATATATLLSVCKEKINYSGTNPLSPITDTYRMPRPITLINNNLEYSRKKD